jgi:16S rRNA (adenine1518-N6/adenine1519-N6)-dimethyltransferase
VIPDKRLGQHFLTDRNILQRIVDALDPAPDDVVVEIGAGTGTLTAVLAPRVERVIAIERDRRLVVGMRDAGCEMRDPGHVTLIEGDALRLDWHALVSEATHPASRIPHPAFKVIGNIPYAITSPLIDKALTPPLAARIVFLVQAEVADRMAAPPGSKAYGALSVGVQAVCRVERLFTVRAGAFTPPPKVESALVRLTPLAQPLVAPEEIARFRAFVTTCFTRRRKQLRNVAIAATGRSAAVVSAGLAALGLDPTVRPETLAPTDFVRLLRWSARL